MKTFYNAIMKLSTINSKEELLEKASMIATSGDERIEQLEEALKELTNAIRTDSFSSVMLSHYKAMDII